MNSFKTITCSKCQSKLVPDLRASMKIGGTSGAISGLIAFGIPTLGIMCGHLVLGLIVMGVVEIALYIAVCNWTYKTLTFEKKKTI